MAGRAIPLVTALQGASNMTAASKSEWLIPAGLLALSVVPVLAGTIRIIQLGTGAAITPENARFFAAPLPVLLHIVSVTLYCILGALQFAPGFRRRNPSWHRATGRVLVPCGLLAALSGLWMTQFYPRIPYDGSALYAIRLVVGLVMLLFLCLGFSAILRRNIARHRAWMMRAYALGLGAGTQVVTHLPWFLFPSIQGELARTLFMGAGWAVNIAVVELILMRERRKSSP